MTTGILFWFTLLYFLTLIAVCVVAFFLLRRRDSLYGSRINHLEMDLRNEGEARHSVEAELRSKEEFYELLINRSNDMLFVHGVTPEGLPGRFIRVNDVACERLDYSREKLLQLTPLDIQEIESPGSGMGYSRAELVTLSEAAVLERANTFARVHVNQLLEKRQLQYERVYLASDGRRIPVEIRSSRLDRLAGPLIVSMVRDVSESRATERALHESEQRFRDFFSSSPTGMAIYDADRRLISANRSCLRILGIPDQSELARFNLLDNPFIPKEERDLIGKGQSVHFEMAVDFDEARRMFMLVSGRRGKAHLEFYVNDIGRDERYNVKGLTVQIMDVTDRRKMELALRDSEKLLRQAQKMEAMGTLAGGIAHDFNNILTPILGYTEMALHMLPEGAPMREFMAEIAKGSYRAKDLVEQILTFSRRSEPEGRPIHIGPIVKEVLNLLRASTPPEIEINRIIKTENDVVMADPTQVHQVVMNLCTNALYAMREKGHGVLDVRMTEFVISPYVKSEFTNLQPGRHLRLTIKDTGSGIDKATQERIFEPFFTTKPRGEGTGMGLAVVHGIISSLKGVITLESEAGIGTTFIVVLPTVEAALLPNPSFPIRGKNCRVSSILDQRSAPHCLFRSSIRGGG